MEKGSRRGPLALQPGGPACEQVLKRPGAASVPLGFDYQLAEGGGSKGLQGRGFQAGREERKRWPPAGGNPQARLEPGRGGQVGLRV